MSVKSLVAGVAALTAVGAAAVGATVLAVSASPAAAQVRPVVFEVPLDQTAALPTADQLVGVLNGLADPNVPFANKSNLVEGGIGPVQAAMADHHMQKAASKGELPLAFNVANIAPAGPGAASADVTVSGPKLAARTMNVTFVNQGGWMLSSGSAAQLLQAASGK
ncbi:hypothetical protein ACAG26_25850 [Mycobacterium sp. pUA109]|uniref:hypothetical protein n=1 Tax=Mycobacterium sp. pUA109 TaxID=3238982 RepID=UPI00351B45D0